ncbi:TPA: type IV conjugative transfer system pilin TraA [Escherichia coli]
MNTVLSVQGASAPVKKKSFFSKFTRLNMLRLARAVIPAAVLMMFFPHLAMAAQGAGQDLMQSGNSTVKATFGKDSSVVKWVAGGDESAPDPAPLPGVYLVLFSLEEKKPG